MFRAMFAPTHTSVGSVGEHPLPEYATSAAILEVQGARVPPDIR